MNELYALSRSLITDLNDDCLYNIFKSLGVRDQLHLAKTCSRFRFIVKQMIWRNVFRETCTNSDDTDELNNDEYQDLFRETIEFMEKLTVADNRHLVFASYLGRYTRRPELAFYFSFQFPRLTSFECHDGRLHDGLLRLLVQKCPQLQRLRVSSDYITGAYLKDMRNLKELYLPYCPLRTEHLRDIFECCVNLTHLDVSGGINLMSALGTQKLPKLRDLKLSEESIDTDFLKSFEESKNFELTTLTVVDLLQEPLVNQYWKDFLECADSRIVALSVVTAKDILVSAMSEFTRHASKLRGLHFFCERASSRSPCLESLAKLPSLQYLQLYVDPMFERYSALVNIIDQSEHLQRVDLLVTESCEVNLLWLLETIEGMKVKKRRQPLTLNVARAQLENYEAIRNEKGLIDNNQSMLKITFDTSPLTYTVDTCYSETLLKLHIT